MPKVVINNDRCKACELCVTFCPQDCMALGNELNSSGYYTVCVTKPEDCKGCGICADMCPDLAIEVYK